MVEVQIGDVKKDIKDAPPPSWIREQLDRRRREGESVCVQVFIDKSPLHMRLATPDCPRAVGTRRATAQEQEIFNLWEIRRLNNPDFTSGNLIAFLRQIS